MTNRDGEKERVLAEIAVFAVRLRETGLDPLDVGHALVAGGLDEIAEALQCAGCIREHYSVVLENIQSRLADLAQDAKHAQHGAVH